MVVKKTMDERSRREAMLKSFIIWSAVKTGMCVIGGLLAGFLLGGGEVDDLDSPVLVIRRLREAGFDRSRMPLGILLGLLGALIWFSYSFADYQRKKNSRVDEEYGSSKLMTKADMRRFNQLFFYDPKVCRQIKPKRKTMYDQMELKTICRWPFFSKAEFNECFKNSQIMGQDVYVSMNAKFINRNLNTITIGGSGQGKSFSELFPNALNANCNYIFTDPSGEIAQKVGKFLKKQGYKLRVFNVDDFELSMKYNPIAYIKTEKDYNILVDAMVENINTKPSIAGNDFFEKGAKSLECALIALLRELYPDNPEKQTFSNVMELLRMAKQEADKKTGKVSSTLDGVFRDLKKKNPRSYACKAWENFCVGGPKVCNEIIISAAADFGRYFDNPDIAWLTSTDELHLEELATEEKVALFLIIPQSTKTYNFLCLMIYSQIFDIVTKAGKAWRDKNDLDDPKLPRHLSFWLDEFANCGKIPGFLELLSVVRKYNISINIIIQGMAQLKGMYPKEEWEVILANLDTMIYLGGMEPSTVKWLSEKIGKETIKSHSYNRNNKSSGESYQNMGRYLLSPDEIEKMSRAYELVFISGCKPIQTRKYNLTLHPNYSESGEADRANNLKLAVELADYQTKVDLDALDRIVVTESDLRKGFDGGGSNKNQEPVTICEEDRLQCEIAGVATNLGMDALYDLSGRFVIETGSIRDCNDGKYEFGEHDYSPEDFANLEIDV